MKHYYTSRATLFQKIYSFVAEANPISDIINYYFIMDFKKKSGKNKIKLRTIYHSPDSCQQECKFPRVAYIPIFWQVLEIFSLVCSNFLSKQKVIG